MKYKEPDWNHLFTLIRNLLENEKLYTKPDITLAEIAQRLSTNVNYISKAVNRGYGNNFNDLLAEYRVKMACHLLQRNNRYEIDKIACECGFGSRASFYRHFKRIKGCSPAEFARMKDQ